MMVSKLKQYCLYSLIGFLSLSAIVAIVSLLGGSFGELQIKIILSTLTVACTSICGMACSAFLEKRGHWPIASAGMLLAVVAALTILTGLWAELDGMNYWRCAISLAVLAVACAHCLLLWIPELARAHRWSRLVLTFLDAALCLLILYAIWFEIELGMHYRMIGTAAVLVVLFTLLVPILSRLGRATPNDNDSLLLTRHEGNVFRDADGVLYRLDRLP